MKNSLQAFELGFQFADQLDGENMHDCAEIIRDAILGGATGHEIIGRLRAAILLIEKKCRQNIFQILGKLIDFCNVVAPHVPSNHPPNHIDKPPTQ